MKIKYFAWIKDYTNKDFENIDKDFPKTINDLEIYLIKKYPELEKHIKNSLLRYAINMEYSSVNKKLDINDEIAIFPPVSGG